MKFGTSNQGCPIQLNKDERQGGESLLTIHDVNFAIYGISDVGIEVIPGIFGRDDFLFRVEVFEQFVFLVELVEDIVQ